MDFTNHEKEKQQWIENHIYKPNPPSEITHANLVELASRFYENGISCLDLMEFVETSEWWHGELVIKYQMEFHKIKSEYRCEKLLILYMLDVIYFSSN
jgi:hypothetical protein